jgi:ubiquinone/menaquinone biosynthesis C-methylase UbiE
MGRVLELACGTGLWTVELARHATSVTAVDASPEVLEINRVRLREAGRETAVRYVGADLFDLRPDAAYDVVFFGSRLSHVPPERFEVFWDLVRSALRPGGRVFFVDSLGPETPDERERRSRDPQRHTTIRRLDDGREYRIVKVFYDPATLERRLAGLGWNVCVHTTEHLLYGFGEPLA